MKATNLSGESKKSQEYSSPLCKVISLKTRTILCLSETENVGETEGEW